jgi:OCT family organic cation transporter-like MFS transporter 4/5
MFSGDKDLQWVTIAFAMAGKFSVSSSNAVMPVFTAELFPTVVRNLGVGSSNVPAGIALMLVPYLWNLVSIEQSVSHSSQTFECKDSSTRYDN